MINGIIFEERDNTAKNWGSVFRNMFPQDGTLNGCGFSASASTITMVPGHFILCGRIFENVGTLDIPVEIGVQAGYVRVLYRVDLSITPEESPAVFSQGEIKVDFSATPIFQELTQQDLNEAGLIYEQELAVYQIAGGVITTKIRTLPIAAYNGVVLRNENGIFEIYRENDYVRFTTKPAGGAEVTAIRIKDDGTTEFTGSFDIKGNFNTAGDIVSGGSALFANKIGLLGPDGTFQFKWGNEDGTGLVNLGFALDGPAPIKSMTFFPDGKVTIPQAVPQYNDDLLMNANIIFALQNKGVVSTATGVEKNMLLATQAGDLLVGDSDKSNTGADTIIRARDSVALRPYQSVEGFPPLDALVARWNQVDINTPLTVSGLLKAAGGLEIAGTFKTSGLEAGNLTITDSLVSGSGGSVFSKPVRVDALLTADKGLTVNGAFIIDIFTANTLTVKTALVSEGLFSANKGLNITGSVTQEASGTAVFGVAMGIKESGGKQFMIRYPDTGSRDYVNLSFVDGNQNTLRIRSDGTVESGGTFKAGVNTYGQAAMEVTQSSVSIMQPATAGNLSVTGTLTAASFNPSRIDTNSLSVRDSGNNSIFIVGTAITAHKSFTAQGSLIANSGITVTSGNIVQNSTANIAQFGYEMAITGRNSNRFSIGYLSEGNADNVGIYTRIGTTRINAMNIMSDGTVIISAGISVPNLTMRGSKITCESSNAIRLCHNTGVWARNQADTAWVNMNAADFVKQTSYSALKENAVPFVGALEKLRAMPVYEYDYKDSGQHQIGVMIEEAAPEVLQDTQVDPEFAAEAGLISKKRARSMGSGETVAAQALSMYEMIALDYAATQELADKVDTLVSFLVSRGIATEKEINEILN